FAELRRLNLLGIFSAHSGQYVRVDQPALEEVEFVELLHLIQGENLPWKEQLLGGRRRKRTLIGGIMNRQNHTCAVQYRVGSENRAQVNGNQRRLPVVYMEDLR